MLVSSEDYNIRVFKGNELIGEHAETEIVTGLAPLPDGRFAYSVSNGTVGVYEQDIRLWRVKVSYVKLKTLEFQDRNRRFGKKMLLIFLSH